jgi:hypothetical protein
MDNKKHNPNANILKNNTPFSNKYIVLSKLYKTTEVIKNPTRLLNNFAYDAPTKEYSGIRMKFKITFDIKIVIENKYKLVCLLYATSKLITKKLLNKKICDHKRIVNELPEGLKLIPYKEVIISVDLKDIMAAIVNENKNRVLNRNFLIIKLFAVEL